MKKVFVAVRCAVCVTAGISMLMATAAQASEDATVIRVESSTIGDRFENKRQEPSNIATISGETVDDSHSQNIQMLLQSIPGVTTELQSGDSLKIHIRGVENQRYMGEKPGVAVVIDGVPVFERTGRVNIDLDNIESIKVVKGGASYLYGEDALAGAVIITTKRGAKMAGYKVEGEAGSFGHRKALARAGFASENASGHLQVSQRQTDGYYFDADSKAAYVNGKWQYYLDEVSDVTVGFEWSDREKDSHGTVEGFSQAESDPQSVEGRDYTRMYDVDLDKLFVTYARDISDSTSLSLNSYQFRDHTQYVSAPQKYDALGAPITDVDAYTRGNDYHQVQRGIKAELRSEGNQLAWMGGLDLRDNRYDNYAKNLLDFKTSPFSPTVYTAGDVTQDDVTDERVYALYSELKGSVSSRLILTANYRYDHIALDYHDNLQALDLDKSFQVGSSRLGANYRVSKKMDLYSNLSTGFRAPTITQLFSGDTSPTGSTESNPDLKPEQSLNIELGLRGEFNSRISRWDYDLAIFQISRDDFIMSTSGQYSIPEAGETERYENIGGVKNRGLELSLRSDINNPISMDIAYTYLDAKFTDYDNFNLILGNRYSPAHTVESYDNTGNVVPRTPKHHINVKLTGRISDAFSLTGEMDAISSYYADELNQFEIGGHSVYNLLANYEVAHNRIGWSFYLRIDNLLDRDYYNTARSSSDRNADGVYNQEDLSITVNPGRRYIAGVSAKF